MLAPTRSPRALSPVVVLAAAAATLAIGARPAAQRAPSPYAAHVAEYAAAFDAISIDPIQMTRSGRVHGWASGDGVLTYLWFYEATGRTAYLDAFVTHADRLLALRDSERGLPDFRGKLLPLWRTEDTYLGKQVLLRNAGGQVLASFQTDTAQDWRKPGAPGRDVLRVERGTDGRFALELTLFEGSDQRQVHRWTDLTLTRPTPGAKGGHYGPEHVEADRPLHRRRFHLRDLAGPDVTDRQPVSGEFELLEGRYARTTNTGTITFPLAYFARLVAEQPGLRANQPYAEAAARYVRAVRDALAAHEDEWRETASDGWYDVRPGAPVWNAGLDEPVNRYTIVGLAMLELARATGDQQVQARVRKLAQGFKEDLDHDARADAYLWNYWKRDSRAWTSPQPREDTSHAGVNALFAYWCHRSGLVFDQQDARRFANTWLKLSLKKDGEIADRIDGHGEGNPDVQWRWLPLGTVNPALYESGRAWIRRKANAPKPATPATSARGSEAENRRYRLGLASLAWTAAQLDRAATSPTAGR